MPGAPRFTQKPSIQQTAQGDLLMECNLEADPPPDVRWHHAGQPIAASSRVQLKLDSVAQNIYKAVLVIKEPNAGDGGAYKCTASNQLGESNANINLNFAGTEERAATPSQKGPSFVGKPRIIPKDGGALILMECKVKSASRPTAKWSKDGTPLSMGALYQDVFADLGDGTFLCQLEIKRPTANEAGQYRCNIRNDLGETNANLSLNFQQEEAAQQDDRRSPSVGRKSPRPGKHREGTPKRHKSKSREGSPKKSVRSRTATPTGELNVGNTLQPESASRKYSRTESMEVDQTSAGGTKRKGDTGLPPAPKRDRSRSKSPAPPQTGPEAHKRSPVITEPLKSQIAHTGETVRLECELQCHSSTKITWSKDGKVIQSSSEYSFSFDGRIAQLSVRQMNESKAGLYKCLAESNYGEAQSSAMVKYELTEEEKNERRKNSKAEEAAKRKAAGDDQVVPEKQRVRIVEASPPRDEERRRSSTKPYSGRKNTDEKPPECGVNFCLNTGSNSGVHPAL
ncbi:immunoglobulin i-set domain-containing protein [Ditylenchus destructor]|uniref:Immunoglobulin i-set domain-containing protein n=1 Tax=Ditylenchus destructor TaxID=166010 RepID=A0AAD4NFI9_9BILA|nr:immunoglobulin i-set domain-containing protein [Ditylenchus destructor]